MLNKTELILQLKELFLFNCEKKIPATDTISFNCAWNELMKIYVIVGYSLRSETVLKRGAFTWCNSAGIASWECNSFNILQKHFE